MVRLIEKLFKNDDRTYPTLRDPEFSPRCYEMTDEERAAALTRSDKLLKERVKNHVSDYYGA